MQERGPSRRLRFVRPLGAVSLPAPRPHEDAAAILPGTPRIGPLDALLREVDDLRLTLETDLTLAAAAVEAGGVDRAAEILDGDLASLHAFEDHALGLLAELSAGPRLVAPRWTSWARVSSAPFVAAAAVIGLLLGVVPNLGGSVDHSGGRTSVSAQSSLEHLTTLAAQGRTSEVRDTALTLHEQISALVGDSSNPVTARQALFLLSYERNVIVQSGDGAALYDVLAQSAALAARISKTLPGGLRTAAPRPAVIAPAVSPEPSPTKTAAKPRSSASPTATAKPTSSPSSSPKPKPTSSPSPTASPTPSSSPTPSTPLLPAGSGDGSGGQATPPPHSG